MKIKKLFKSFILAIIATTLITFPALAVVPDFTTWTEVDTGSDITVTSDNVSWDSVHHGVSAYVYDDLGASVNLSLTANFTARMNSGTGNGGYMNHFAVSDGIGKWIDLIDSGSNTGMGVVSYMTASAPNYRMALTEFDNADEDQSADISISLNTNYYCTFTYDKTVGSYGTIYLDVYTDAARTSLLGSVSEPLEAEQVYRYIYAAVNWGIVAFGSNPIYDHWGFTADMDYNTTYNAPTVTTGGATGITYDPDIGDYWVTLDGQVNDDGGENVTMTFYWRENPSGTWYNSNAVGTYATGANVTRLLWPFEVATTYDYFVVGTNSGGTDNGTIEQFTVTDTLAAPDMTTFSIPITINTTALTATLYGGVLYDGGANVTGWIDWRPVGGASWNSTSNITNLVTSNQYSINVTGLTLGQGYQFKAVGSNIYGQNEGGIAQFTMGDISSPTVETLGTLTIYHNSALVAGNVTDKGGDDYLEVWFRYRELDTVQWINTTSVFTQDLGSYNGTLSGLNQNTNYEFQAVARAQALDSQSFIDYGDTYVFSTISQFSVPIVATGNISWVQAGIVRATGTIENDGGYESQLAIFYGEEGQDFPNATPYFHGMQSGDAAHHLLSGLNNDTIYEYKAVGCNFLGCSDGSTLRFRITTTGGIGDAPTTPAAVDQFQVIIDNAREALGMTGAMGTWAFMGLILLIISICFAPAMFATADATRTAIGIIWALLSIAVAGAFIFTGQLGIWPILILVGGLAVGIIIVASVRLSGSRV